MSHLSTRFFARDFQIKSLILSMLLLVALTSVSLVLANDMAGEVAPASDFSRATANQNIDVIGQLGVTNLTGVGFANNYIYGAAYTNGLRIIDVSDPMIPVEIAHIDPLDRTVNVTFEGEHAYVSDLSGGLRVIDITDPSNPLEVGVYNGIAQDAVIVGNYAYIAGATTGLRIVDVSDVTNPVEVGFHLTPDYAGSLAVSGNYAYIADQFSGLRVIDVSDPTNPTEAGFYNPSGFVTDVAVKGDYAYLTDGIFDESEPGGNEFRVIDISDPQNPVQINVINLPANLRDVVVYDNVAYVTATDGLRLFDISIPANLSEIAFYDTSDGVASVSVDRGYIYASSYGFSGILSILRLDIAVVTIEEDRVNNLVYYDPQRLPTVVQIQVGTVNELTKLSLTSVQEVAEPANLNFAGHAFDLVAYQSDIEIPGFTFQKPVTISIEYSEVDVKGIDESQLLLTYWDGSEWVDAATTCNPSSQYSRDLTNNNLSVPICHLSRYALFGPSSVFEVFLPAIIR